MNKRPALTPLVPSCHTPLVSVSARAASGRGASEALAYRLPRCLCSRPS